ncbi:Clp protease N-terminal domain-containing protein [Candidatus Poribacteria bacterium]
MRYSERSQSIIQFARQEAARLGHEHISTGHLLLGLIREGAGTAVAFLKDANVDLENMKDELENMMESKGRGAVIGQSQITSRAEKALKMAAEESQNMGHKYVGTEHILIGLISEWEGVASKTLIKSGIDLDKARAAAQDIVLEEDEHSETLTFHNVEVTVPTPGFNENYPSTNFANEVLDIEEASRLLRITVHDLNKLLKNEDLPARIVSGHWRFSRRALIKWLGEGNSRDYAGGKNETTD